MLECGGWGNIQASLHWINSESDMLWAGQPDKSASAYYIGKYKNLILTLVRCFYSAQKLSKTGDPAIKDR